MEPDKTKIIVIVGIILALFVAIFLVLSFKELPTSPPIQKQNELLNGKIDSSDLGIFMKYPDNFEIVKNNNQNFVLRDKSNPFVLINIQKINGGNNGDQNVMINLIDALKKELLKKDKDCQFMNETKFIKKQNNNSQQFPGMGFEAQYKQEGMAVKYFLAVIQKGAYLYVFSLTSPKANYSQKILAVTSMLGTLNFK